MKPFLLDSARFAVIVALFYGASTIGLSQPRLQPDFRCGIDSLRPKSMPQHPLHDILNHNSIQRPPTPVREVVSPQSSIYVIDTAIVRRSGYFTDDPGDTTRHLYAFNTNAKRISGLTERLKGDLWVDTERQTNTYDAYENMLSELHEDWANGQWVNSSRATYTYDAYENMLSDLVEYWANGQWVNSSRATYTYDANGNMTSESHGWRSERGWLNWGITYTYDANGNKLTQVWNEGGGRITYIYDESGNMLSELFEDTLDGQWVIQERVTCTYNASGDRLSLLAEAWENNRWVAYLRYTYTYDVTGTMLSELYEDWSNGQWVNSSRATFTYDANGNRLTGLRESWSDGQWVNDWRYTYTYDLAGNLTAFWHQGWLNSFWAPLNDAWSIADSAGNLYFYQGYGVSLSYKLTSTGVASENGNLPAIYSLSQNYPNPFNPSTTINYELPVSSDVRLSVYDLLGREVSVLVDERRDAGVHEVTYDGSHLASGVYFYRLQVRPLDFAIGRDPRSGAGDFVQSRSLMILK